MKNSVYGFVLLLLVLLGSCRKDFDFEPSTGQLAFSKDTVYLDTVFTNVGSSTYTLKVYNRSNKNIQIPQIRLKNGADSQYRLLVDGLSGKSFDKMELLAKDSMFVFIETTIDYDKFKNDDGAYLYTDMLEFTSANATQAIPLVTLVRDAHFLYPYKGADGVTESLPIGEEHIHGFMLSDNDPIRGNTLHWTADKPYVIYGYAGVPKNKELVIDPGASIYFHETSGILAAEKATITAKGTLEHPILFQGDRLEYSFRYTPGQWGTIWMTPDSEGHFEYVTLNNPTIGLYINKNKNTVVLNNVQIYNAAQYGILAQTASLSGQNVVIGSAGIASLACSYGGSYEFIHSSFVNLWNKPNHTAVWIDDADGSAPYRLTKATFANCLLYSNANESLILKSATGLQSDFNLYFDSNFIKFYDYSNRQYGVFPYNFEQPNRFANNSIARNTKDFPLFFNDPSKNRFEITDKATAVLGKGNPFYTAKSPRDLLGKDRLTAPDLGAYQHILHPED